MIITEMPLRIMWSNALTNLCVNPKLFLNGRHVYPIKSIEIAQAPLGAGEQ